MEVENHVFVEESSLPSDHCPLPCDVFVRVYAFGWFFPCFFSGCPSHFVKRSPLQQATFFNKQPDVGVAGFRSNSPGSPSATGAVIETAIQSSPRLYLFRSTLSVSFGRRSEPSGVQGC